MLQHLRRRVTQYRPATPVRPEGYGGVEAFASLALLPDAHGIAFVAPPCICPGHPRQRVCARNAAAQNPSATC